MKNRKTVVVAFLLVAAMLLGVGYAALTDDLLIDGTVVLEGAAVSEDFNGAVKFTDAGAENAGDSANVSVSDEDIAEFYVGSLKTLNETTYVWFAITSDYELPVKISVKDATGATSDHFKVAYAYFKDAEMTQPFDIANDVLNAGQPSVYVKGTVTLTALLDDADAEANEKLEVILVATAVQ